MAVAHALEVFAVAVGPLHAVGQVALEALLEVLVRQLLQQHRRQADDEVRAGVEEHALVDHRQDRQVGFGGGLVEPVLAVRPDAVAQDVGQVTVQHETEAAYGHGLIVIAGRSQSEPLVVISP